MAEYRSPSQSTDPEKLKDSNVLSITSSNDATVKATQDGVVVEDPITGELRTLSASFTIDPVLEKRVVWKIDIRVLPTLAFMYLCNALDKGNLGNAKTAGLEETLNLKSNDYNLLLMIFFIPYVLTAPFLAMLGKKYGPSRVLPCMMFTFGLMTLMYVPPPTDTMQTD